MQSNEQDSADTLLCQRTDALPRYHRRTKMAERKRTGEFGFGKDTSSAQSKGTASSEVKLVGIDYSQQNHQVEHIEEPIKMTYLCGQ